jgi:transcriptional regulator with XRE-family HTH domain
LATRATLPSVRGRLEKVLARRLREVAKQKGVALSHVADRADLARSYFWLLLNGKSSATLDAVQRIAEALDVEPLRLLSGQAEATATKAAPRVKVETVAAEPRTRRSKRT